MLLLVFFTTVILAQCRHTQGIGFLLHRSLSLLSFVSLQIKINFCEIAEFILVYKQSKRRQSQVLYYFLLPECLILPVL